jgi:hypothetical protein
VTTGVPIYLVSACTSGEEFVAAFRRYADRNGLFVPIAEPIAAGRRARFALTLRDGGVMVEGDGEVVSSARTPSVLHGRIGMTIRFADLDPQSKTVLVELEKARLAMKPLPPSVPPRPAEIPATPRPVPPTPAGRIDANNALAECVVIGDLDRHAAPEARDPRDSREPKTPPKAGPRFVVPTIPPVVAGAQRPRSPSVPPLGMPPIAPPPRVAPPPTTPPASVTRPPSSDDSQAVSGAVGAFSATMPAISIIGLTSRPGSRADSSPGSGDDTAPHEPLVPELVATEPDLEPELRGGTRQMHAVVPSRTRAQVMAAVAPPPNTTPTEMSAVPEPPITAQMDALLEELSPAEIIDLPVHDDAVPVAVALPAAPPSAGLGRPLAGRATPPPVPVVRAPTPAGATPTVPGPPVLADARPQPPAIEIEEPTDLTEVPVPQAPDEFSLRAERVPRKTVLGIAVSPSGAAMLPALPNSAPIDDKRDTSVVKAQDVLSAGVVGSRDIDGRAKTLEPVTTLPTIEEPSGDWTMTPGVDGPPTIEERTPTPKVPTGDWLISLDAAAPDGWTEPAKVEKLPPIEVEPPAPAKPRAATAKPRAAMQRKPEPIAAVERAEHGASFEAEPKVQVDPTLIEPLAPMPVEDQSSGSIRRAAVASASGPLGGAGPVPAPVPTFGSGPTAGPAVAAAPGDAARSGRIAMATSDSQPLAPVAMPPGSSSQMFTPAPATSRTSASHPQVTSRSSASHPRIDSRASASHAAVVINGADGVIVDEAKLLDRDPTSMVETGRSRRTVVIIASALVAALIGIVLYFVVFDPSTPSDEDTRVAAKGATIGSERIVEPTGSGDPGTGPGSGSASAGTLAVDAAVAVAPPPDAAAACFIDVTSTPAGAEIVLDKTTVLGTTPVKLPLPCAAEVKLVIRKARYTAVQRSIVPTTEGTKLRVALVKPTFSVKVSSQPTGATITMNGRSMGVTPTTVRLPAFELSTLTITKEGWTPDTQKIAPKQNNQAVYSTLKKLVRRGR